MLQLEGRRCDDVTLEWPSVFTWPETAIWLKRTLLHAVALNPIVYDQLGTLHGIKVALRIKPSLETVSISILSSALHKSKQFWMEATATWRRDRGYCLHHRQGSISNLCQRKVQVRLKVTSCALYNSFMRRWRSRVRREGGNHTLCWPLPPVSHSWHSPNGHNDQIQVPAPSGFSPEPHPPIPVFFLTNGGNNTVTQVLNYLQTRDCRLYPSPPWNLWQFSFVASTGL